MERGTISVIVPVYNCGKYLKECVDSIREQSYKYWELILVDDGSTDQSGQMCDEYQRIDDRIRVIHKRNGGQQDARSVGIDAAQGEYIAFVDSDDWIEKEMYEKLLEEMKDADLVTSGVFLHDAIGSVKEVWVDPLPEGIYEQKEKIKIFFENLIMNQNYKPGEVVFGGITNNVICKLFRASIVKTMFQKANVYLRYEEDALFSLLYALQCRKIRVTHKCYYHYRYNGDSVTNAAVSEYWERGNIFYTTLNKALRGHWMEETLKKQLQKRYFYSFYGYIAGLNNVDIPIYTYPDEEELNDKKIVLFGAGKVGRNFYRDMEKNRRIEIVLWIDNHIPQEPIMERNIESPQCLLDIEYDYVLCAVKKKEIAENMEEQLIHMGIVKSKILWKEPFNLFVNMIFG